MKAALGLAARGLGRVWPNPAVGCVIVQPDDGPGRVVGRGWTAPGGRPHAETVALDRAADMARGATVYVTLEPCAHDGQTPPCAAALIAAGIGRAVIAIEDPDPRVAGRGLAMLRDGGVEVVTGIGAAAAEEVNIGFLKRIRQGRPMVTLKTATTLDGRIATGAGVAKWITGEAARARGHLLRACHDAILTGAGTVAADDPDLTCRLAGLEDRSPLRVIADTSLRTPPAARVIATARSVPTWMITLAGADQGRGRALRANGVEIITVAADAAGRPDLGEALLRLGERGLTRLLVEAGGTLTAALLGAGLVDRVAWFRSARIFGGDGAPMAAAFGALDIAAAPRLERLDMIALGDDVLETYAVRA